MDRASYTTAYSRSRTIGEYTSTEDISKEMDILAQENFFLSQTAEVLERCLKKKSPATLAGVERFIEMAPPVMRSSLKMDTSSIISTKSSPSPLNTVIRSSTTSSMTHGLTSRSNALSFGSCKISPVAMADMVERELEEGRMTMDKLKRKFKSTKFLLQTEEENLRVGIDILKANKTSFEHFVILNTESQNGKVVHDKFLRFLEYELQTGDRILRKMKLKTKTMQKDYKRILAQQQQKLELRERLHPIDIEKLLIENEEQLDILELKNKTLQDLKKTAGKRCQNLVSVKSKLNDIVLSLKNLKHDSELKETKCKFMEELQIQNEVLLEAAEFNNQHIKDLYMTYKCSDVHSYLQIQSSLEDIKSEKDIWKRRINYQLQNIALLEHQVKQLSKIPQVRRGTNFRSQSLRRLTQ